jgi:hypothetical protein
MSATSGPARSILGELAIDIVFATSADRHARDHLEHVRRMWTCANGAHEHFDLTVQPGYSFVELDRYREKPASTRQVSRAQSAGPYGLQKTPPSPLC